MPSEGKPKVEVKWPFVGQVYHDDQGRTLEVTDLRPDCELGRNIIGILRWKKPNSTGIYLPTTSDYSCSLPNFELIWKEVPIG